MFASLLRRHAFAADGRRGPPPPTHVRRLDRSDDPLSGELTLIGRLSVGDCILCVAGEIVPCDGMVVDRAAFVGGCYDGQAQTHARVEIGSRVFGGVVVLSDYVIVRVGAPESPRST